MKKTLYVTLMLIAITCLVGCGKNETHEEFKNDFTVECETSRVLDQNLNNEAGTVLDEITTFYFNKQGLLYLRKDKSIYHFINSDAFKVLKETAEEGYKNKDYEEIEIDEENMILTIVSSVSDDPDTYSKKDRDYYYVTNYLQDNEYVNDTCKYNGITKEEVENAK